MISFLSSFKISNAFTVTMNASVESSPPLIPNTHDLIPVASKRLANA